MVKQSPRLPESNVSANSASMWSSRLQEDSRLGHREKGTEEEKKEKKETEKQTGDMRSPLLINHWVCVMTSAATLKLNFSQAFKTLLKAKHSHSQEVKR